jgi:hypothetical protein
MADTQVTVADIARQELAKVNTDGAGWYTDAEIFDRALQHVLAPAATYQFTRVAAGYWTWASKLGGQNKRIYLLGLDFSGAVGATYRVSAAGTIQLLTGSDDSTTLTAQAATLDFGELMVDLLTSLATAASQQGQQTIGNANFGMQSVADQCFAAAAIWRGVKCA